MVSLVISMNVPAFGTGEPFGLLSIHVEVPEKVIGRSDRSLQVVDADHTDI